MYKPKFEKTQLKVLENLINLFFVEYLKQFPDENLKRKVHFLQHYPKMIERFGPLVKTMRFEAKHSYFKAAIHCSKNGKNFCFILARRHQMLMYLHYQKPNLLVHDEEALEQPISEILKQNLVIGVSDLSLQAKAVVFEGQMYNVDEVVV